MDIYTLISRLVPDKINKNLKQLISYSTIQAPAHKFLGFMIFFGLGLGFVIGYFLNYFGIMHFILGFTGGFAVTEILIYEFILLSVDSKAKFVESVLPDALQIMSSNMRAGLTTDKALLLAARPEFGPLADEIQRIGRETMTGRSFISALLRTTEHIKSDTLSKTIDLIVNGLKSGGQLTDLLDQISDDLRNQQMLEKEIGASVLMYAIFIFIAIGIAAPLLFSMSAFLVKMLVNMGTMIGSVPKDIEEVGGSVPISMTSMSISSEFINTYSVVSLIVSSVFGSMIIGLILKGNAKSGLVYMLILVLLSVSLFFLGSYAMESVLGGMMQMQ